MSAHRLLAVVAAVTAPVLLFASVELVSIEQPAKVQPGATFSATVNAVGHEWPWPVPLASARAPDPAAVPAAATDPAPVAATRVRLGVLVPQDWSVGSVSYQVNGQPKTGLQSALLGERAQYDLLHPAPPGYSWRAFGPTQDVVGEGREIRFYVQITTADKNGIYRVGYMTWQGVWPMPAQSEGASTDQVDVVTVEQSPSYLETEITVGEVGPAPRVTSFDPPDAGADVPVDTNIRITFDRDMDVQSLRQGGVQLYGGPVWFANGRPGWKVESGLDPSWLPPPWPPSPVPIQVFYSADTRTAVIDPVEKLLGNTVYTVVVTREARAVDGVPIEAPVSADFLTAPGSSSPMFVDVPPQHIFREAIETLARAGVVAGYPDGTFRPDASLTRAQLATMLVRLLGVHTSEPGVPAGYADMGTVPAQTADFIDEATRAGIVEGFPDRTFRPNDTVTRIQLVRMVVRAAQGWLGPPPPGFDAGFTDVLPLDLSFVNWAFYNRLVDGKAPGLFDPWSNATRGHASRVLYGVWLTMPRPLAQDGG
jgi:hypothetical protein